MNPAALWAILSQGFMFFALVIIIVHFALTMPFALLSPVKVAIFLGISSALMILWDRKMNWQKLRNPFKTILVIPWAITSMFYLAIVCLLSLDQDAWGNRIKTTPTPPTSKELSQ
jgi:hypothetical protein